MGGRAIIYSLMLDGVEVFGYETRARVSGLRTLLQGPCCDSLWMTPTTGHAINFGLG